VILIGLGTVVIVYVRELAGPAATSSVVAAAIVSISVGQAVGPAAAGLLAETSGSMAFAFGVATVACAIGGPVALLVRSPR
jgi:hypothetical protein